MPFRDTTCTFPHIEHYLPLPKTEEFLLLEGQQHVLSRHPLLTFKFWDLVQGFMVRFGGWPAHTLYCAFPYLKRQLANAVIRTSPFFLHSFDFSSCTAPVSLIPDWNAWERTVNKPISKLCPKYWLWLLIGVFRYRSKCSYWLPKDRISRFTSKMGLRICFTEKIHLGWPYVCCPLGKQIIKANEIKTMINIDIHLLFTSN